MTFHPTTHFDFGVCVSSGHRHYQADGYEICDYVGRFWLLAEETTPEVVREEVLTH